METTSRLIVGLAFNQLVFLHIMISEIVVFPEEGFIRKIGSEVRSLSFSLKISERRLRLQPGRYVAGRDMYSTMHKVE